MTGGRRRRADETSGLAITFEIVVAGSSAGDDDRGVPDAGAIEDALERAAGDGSLESAVQSEAANASVAALEVRWIPRPAIRVRRELSSPRAQAKQVRGALREQFVAPRLSRARALRP